MKVLVLLNDSAGTLAASQDGDERQRIAAAFGALGAEADVRSIPAAQIPGAARAAATSDADLVVAGGGDGTINAVASQLVHSGKPFGILPLGTLNHLAKELGMPEDLDAACAALVLGQARPFNIGQVNGRYFLSFSAIGVYSHVIKHRDAQRRVLGRGKWTAMAAAFFRILRTWPVFRVHLKIGTQSLRRFTPLVFLALSEYQMRLFGVEEYACRGRSALSLYLASRTSRLGLIWMLLKAIFGRLRPQRDFQAMCVDSVDLAAARRRSVRVALDGEVEDLCSPLHYRFVEGGLHLVHPPPAPSEPMV